MSRVDDLTENITYWQGEAQHQRDVLAQETDPAKRQRLQARIDGIEAGVVRDAAERDVLVVSETVPLSKEDLRKIALGNALVVSQQRQQEVIVEDINTLTRNKTPDECVDILKAELEKLKPEAPVMPAAEENVNVSPQEPRNLSLMDRLFGPVDA